MYKEDDIIGQRIKSIRLGDNKNKRSYNQKEFAKAIGATVQALSNWENGRNKPNDIRLKAIAELGEISVNELLYGSHQEYINNLITDDELKKFDISRENMLKLFSINTAYYPDKKSALGILESVTDSAKKKNAQERLGYNLYIVKSLLGVGWENFTEEKYRDLIFSNAEIFEDYEIYFDKKIRDVYEERYNRLYELNNDEGQHK